MKTSTNIAQKESLGSGIDLMFKGHSPGPWFVHIEHHSWGTTPHVTKSSAIGLYEPPICTFNGLKYREGAETEANARLIAAAPAMLRVVQLANDAAEAGAIDECYLSLIRDAIAALSK